MACELRACIRGCAFSLYAAGLEFRVSGWRFTLYGLGFKAYGPWYAAFRSNAPQPGRGGRREAFKITGNKVVNERGVQNH